jgi:hypothetical protein
VREPCVHPEFLKVDLLAATSAKLPTANPSAVCTLKLIAPQADYLTRGIGIPILNDASAMDFYNFAEPCNIRLFLWFHWVFVL